MTLTRRERRLIARLSTPLRVQQWLNELPYNTEKGGETLRSFRPVARLEDRALPRGRALRGGGHGAARLSAAGHEPRIAGQPGSRHLHLPPSWRDGDRWPARAIPDCTAGKPVFRLTSRAGSQLHRPVCGLHGPGAGVWRLQSRRGDGHLRLAALGEERLEGRAGADRLAASQDRQLDRALSTVEALVSRVSRDARRSQADRLSRQGEVDADSDGISR